VSGGFAKKARDQPHQLVDLGAIHDLIAKHLCELVEQQQ
jgi:hypothetical protein